MLPTRFLTFVAIFLPASPGVRAEAAAQGVSGGSFLQAMLALCFIVALLGAMAWLARRVSGGKAFGRGGLCVVGGVALGPKERIVVIEVGDEWLVIGVVPGQIRTLHRLPKGELPPDSALPPIESASFSHWLNQFRNKSGDARGA